MELENQVGMHIPAYLDTHNHQLEAQKMHNNQPKCLNHEGMKDSGNKNKIKCMQTKILSNNKNTNNLNIENKDNPFMENLLYQQYIQSNHEKERKPRTKTNSRELQEENPKANTNNNKLNKDEISYLNTKNPCLKDTFTINTNASLAFEWK